MTISDMKQRAASLGTVGVKNKGYFFIKFTADSDSDISGIYKWWICHMFPAAATQANQVQVPRNVPGSMLGIPH